MKTRSMLLAPPAAAVVCLLTVWPSAAYIKAPPQTLGSVCLESDHICVLKVETANAETGVIVFQHVEQLKGKHDGAAVKHLVKPNLGEGIKRTAGTASKVILAAATVGQTAVMFYFTGGTAADTFTSTATGTGWSASPTSPPTGSRPGAKRRNSPSTAGPPSNSGMP